MQSTKFDIFKPFSNHESLMPNPRFTRNMKSRKGNMHNAVYDDSPLRYDDELCCVVLASVVEKREYRKDCSPMLI